MHYRDARRQAGYVRSRPVPNEVDVVVARRAFDDHVVDRAVAGAAAHRRREADVELAHARAGEVVDGDGVSAAQGVDVDVLDAVDVHRDVADVTKEFQPSAVVGEGDVLGHVGAVERHRVITALALDRVAAVPGIPGEGVVAPAADERVVTPAAVKYLGDRKSTRL